MTDLLQEAHAPADFHEKVKGLEQGEVARLKGGVAVKRVALEDGRDAFRVSRPGYSNGEVRFPEYADAHRTPEEATRGAFAASGESKDPESIGGTTRLSRYAPLMHDGKECRVADWGLDGKAMIAPRDAPGRTRSVDPGQIKGRSPALYESDEELVESAQTAALSTTHAPIGKGGKNWITQSKPGNTGQLPAYIQNVRNAIMRGGTPESKATAIAIGRVEDWAAGKGNVGPEVKAAAAKAVAELSSMRGKTKVTEEDSDAAFWLSEPVVEAYSEASRAAALAARKAKHPDWKWGADFSGESGDMKVNAPSQTRPAGVVSRQHVYHGEAHVGHIDQVKGGGSASAANVFRAHPKAGEHKMFPTRQAAAEHLRPASK